MKAADKINKDEEKIKIIYGVEAYFMDDLVESVKGDADTGFDGTFICFDIETTGLSAAVTRLPKSAQSRLKTVSSLILFQPLQIPKCRFRRKSLSLQALPMIW
jgi:DNA polymerase III alpha subunit (gram-positive type)